MSTAASWPPPAGLGREVGGGAHDLLDLGGVEADAGVDLGVADREVGDLDRDLAVDIGAVDLVVGDWRRRRGGRAGGSGGRVVGEDA